MEGAVPILTVSHVNVEKDNSQHSYGESMVRRMWRMIEGMPIHTPIVLACGYPPYGTLPADCLGDSPITFNLSDRRITRVY